MVYLYNRFLNQPLHDLKFRYSKKPTLIPTVFSHDEAMGVINNLESEYQLIGKLMYGCGLRISEAVRLRIKYIDFGMGYIVIRDGKGAKDRTTLLPKSVIEELQNQTIIVEKRLALDNAKKLGPVYLPNMLAKKYPNAAFSLDWQYLFPSYSTSKDPRSGIERRHHINRSSVQKQVKIAIHAARIRKNASCHTFRHYADNLIMPSYQNYVL